ncbi:hypothetical protein BpHYR1_040771 [Brachionus plicatilis]|uniref:Uncharacterized protein n=1 Tax=Brachionus plicatilis TaxID=10195 RepID=A0A3M7Q2V0_BRAPC|nr:hypothetical protein BpHYR1_040771 [Brachionus plicatilis]
MEGKLKKNKFFQKQLLDMSCQRLKKNSNQFLKEFLFYFGFKALIKINYGNNLKGFLTKLWACIDKL